MASYYYLISSLPMLKTQGEPPMDYAAFLAMCKSAVSSGVYQSLEELTVDETAPKEDRLPRGLYIYMSEEGESLWEIARRYNTSEARIREDNGEMGECCPAGPLLIPG